MNTYLLFGFEDISKLSPKFFNDSIDKLENEINKAVAHINRLAGEYEFAQILFHTNELEVLIVKLGLINDLIGVVGEPEQENYRAEVLNFLLIGLGGDDMPNGRSTDSAFVDRKIATSKSIMSNSAHILHLYSVLDAS